MLLSNSIREMLDFGGPIAAHLENFAPRAEQQHLAQAVSEALDNRAILVGEAGTGIGKTFAYLVPAIASGQRIIVSTGTRHLQDQLFHTDLPLIKRALDAPVSAALLKGRANYLCRHRLVRAKRHPRLRDKEHQKHLDILMQWSRATTTGDKAEVLEVPEDALVWSYVTSTDEFCSQHEFEDQKDCFIFEARKRAQASDIVVVNHHLLCADLALKEEGFGDLLPSANGFVIDEAHQLPEVAASFFGKKLTARQLNDLARDVKEDQIREAPDMPQLSDAADRLENAVRHFRLAFGVEPRKDAWNLVATDSSVEREMEHLDNALHALQDQLVSAEGRSKGLDACRRRTANQRSVLRRFNESVATPDEKKRGTSDADSVNEEDEEEARVPSQYIHWFETYRTGFSLNMTPVDVAEPFRNAMQEMASAWIFTSATLAVGGDFSHFKARLGLKKTEELQVDSPFNYRRNALLYLPEGLPEPSSSSYTEMAMDKVWPVIKASGGRAFILFTSYRAMDLARDWFSTQSDFPVLYQGQMPKRELLDAFQSLGNAVLLGTSSFWEGVDVRGEALSCVIIDKLPFGSPGDPVMSARIHAMQQSGGNPFFEYQLPQAAITLKQGVGRLIRDVTDKGVLVLCDPRIRTREYGEVFINSLPSRMPITNEVEEVQDFFKRERETFREPDLAAQSVAD